MLPLSADGVHLMPGGQVFSISQQGVIRHLLVGMVGLREADFITVQHAGSGWPQGTWLEAASKLVVCHTVALQWAREAREAREAEEAEEAEGAEGVQEMQAETSAAMAAQIDQKIRQGIKAMSERQEAMAAYRATIKAMSERQAERKPAIWPIDFVEAIYADQEDEVIQADPEAREAGRAAQAYVRKVGRGLCQGWAGEAAEAAKARDAERATRAARKAERETREAKARDAAREAEREARWEARREAWVAVREEVEATLAVRAACVAAQENDLRAAEADEADEAAEADEAGRAARETQASWVWLSASQQAYVADQLSPRARDAARAGEKEPSP
jgi:hypothetical protein